MISLISDSKEYGNRKNYVARIAGRNSKMTFEREFLGKTPDIDEPGLFEICDYDRKGRKEISYVLVLAVPEEVQAGGIAKLVTDKEDAMKIARRMDDGESIEQIVVAEPRENRDQWLAEHPGKTGYVYAIRTKGEAKKATVAATVDSATNDCWKVLSLLPEKEAKKVLAALKLRVSPKPAAPETTITEPENPATDETAAS